MPNRKMRCAIKVVVLLFAALLGIGSSQAQSCTTACPRSLPTTIVPKVESTYVYALEAKTLLTPRDTQKVTIKADAEVAIQSICEAVLRLKNVAIEGVPNGADLAAQVAANPIAFGYFNGKVRGVCPTKDEEEWVLNIKRAVVSALQVSANGESSAEIDEEDFSGKCPTTFQKVQKAENGAIVIEKKKDLNKCDERRVDMRQTPDQALGQFKELVRHYLHPMDSVLTCKLTLKDLVVSEVDCEERHTLVHRREKPVHISNVKLTLKDTKSGIANDLAQRETEKKDIFLTYEHKHNHVATESDVVEVLKKLCSEVSDKTASIESSLTFQQLVDKLKYLSDDEAASVDEAVKSGTICPAAVKRVRELFLDASAFAASDSAIKTLVKAHNNKELTISRAAAVFTVVALKAAPNEKTVHALLPLIESETTTRPLLIGFSVLFRRYCEKTNDCATNAGIKEARDAFVSRVGKTTDLHHKVTLIKALENLNMNLQDNENLIKLLDEVVNTEENANARVAAVQAFPNVESNNDKLKDIVLKESNPNEVRIAAFQKLAKNNGLKNVDQFFGVQEHCIKNYILSYLKNLKTSKNSVRRNLLVNNVELPEEPKNNLGITRNIAHEYGPVTFEYDIIYPKDSDVTKAINVRVTRSVGNKVVELVEIQLQQDGLDENVRNILNVLSRKISLPQFGIEALKHLSEFVNKIKKSKHVHNHLHLTVKVNGKNVLYTDTFEDACTLVELLRKRFEKVLSEKQIDRTIGGVLIDSKVVIPSITGIPVIYKVNDNFVIQLNGKGDSNGDKKKFILNRSLIAGLSASMKLKLKDQKLGYEYDAKVAITPVLDIDVDTKAHTIRLNLQDVERHTIFKLKQSLREVRSDGVTKESENELIPEPRSDNCFTVFILNYCRKASQVKGLKLPNVEYYITKPDKAITAIELGLNQEKPGPNHAIYTLKLNAVNSPTDLEHLARVEINSKDKTDIKVTLKSKGNTVESEFSVNLDKSKNFNLNLDLKNLVNIDMKAKFSKDKETNTRNNEVLIDYKFPGDDTVHNIKYKNSLGYNLKRSQKDKKISVDFNAEFESSRRPFLNHKSAVEFQYRPFKESNIVLEFVYGKDLDNKYRFSRKSNIDVAEMKPFTMNAKNEIQLVATDFDVNYNLDSNLKLISNKGIPLEFLYNIKGKDLSKRAAVAGNNDIEGEIDYKNKGSPIDSKVNANLKIRGNEYGYQSELKQVDGKPNNYEGKITIQTGKDKKIFITHKEEVSKPVDEMSVKSEAEITYSYKPEKKNYNIEFTKNKGTYKLKAEAKKNGEVYMNNDMSLERSGKFNLKLTRDYRSYDVDVDNVLNPKVATAVFKIKDRVYNIKMNRSPLQHIDLKVEGNDKALIKNGDAHISLVDPITLNLNTKANTKVEFLLDLISVNNKQYKLKIDSPKFDFVHDGDVQLALLSRRLSIKSHSKKGADQYNLNADITGKGSLITLQRVAADHTSNIKYSRNGDNINIDIDTPHLKGQVEGNRKNGKIHLKNTEKNYELESTYKVENGKVIINSVSGNNAKLEALLSLREPSNLVLESPNVKADLKMNLVDPVKTLHFDFDSPKYQKKIDAEYEFKKNFKYISYGKSKVTSKEHKIELVGVPRKELNLDLSFPDFKFQVKQPQAANKVEFSYTFNNYTETEEYDFDPNKAYLINWLRALRLYAQSFIME